MANPTVDVGTGITITFATTSFTSSILEVTPPGSSRENLNTSHQGTTSDHTFMPSDLTDNGQLDFTMQFDASKTPPTGSAAEIVTIAFPAGAGWDFTGYMFDYQPQGTFENVMTATASVKVSGALDRDASS